MSTEDQANAAQWNDKNLSDRPEADEDARTESSEGSSSKEQWARDVMDSEDEFEDAMEPPSSGMLMTFEGAMPPLSGVYEDAVEATPEQIAAALESTSSNGSGGGRHSMILEEEEEGDTAETEDAGVDDEVVAVVEEIVESTAAAEEEVTPDGGEETVAGEASAEQECPDPVVVDAAEGDADEVGSSEQAPEESIGVEEPTDDEVEVEAAADEDVSSAVEEEVAADEVAESVMHDTSEGDEVPASEADSEVQEPAPSTEETTAEVVESKAVYETANEAELEVAPATRKNEEVSADEDVVAESDDASDEAAEGTAAAVEPADDEAESDAALEDTIVAEVDETEEIVSEVDATTEDAEMEVAATEEAAEVELEAAVDGSSQDVATDAAQEIEEAAPENTSESAPADEDAEAAQVEEMTLEDAVVDEVPAPEDEAAVVEEAGPAIYEDAETEEPTVEEVATAEEVDVEVDAGEPTDVDVGASVTEAENEVATQPENDVTEVSAPIADLTASEVEVAVVQVAEELVEAVQSALDQEDAATEGDEGKVSEAEQVTDDEANEDANEALEEKPAVVTPEATDVPAQDAEAASTDKTESESDPDVSNSGHVEVAVETQANAEENPAEDEPVVAAASKALVDGSRRKSDDEQSHAVVGLLPRLGTSSAPTTATTTEPFIMSCESNEMLDAPVPPQRWSYEVYGFSIEKRVVLYHIHKTDRRAGIREPPILKRYTDFFNLETNLLGTCLRAAADIPRIPRPHLGTVLRGYKSKKTIEVREKAFRQQLRYIAQYPELHGSEIFERFITTSQTTTGAGWM